MAQHVAKTSSTCWLADRHEAVAAAVAAIEEFGGSVGRVVPLRGESLGTANCLHPDDIDRWQAKGYTYRRGFCPISKCCVRAADPEKCPFLKSIDDLKEAESIVVTKALGQRAGFFSTMGNPHRRRVVLDEDPIGLLRPLVSITHDELEAYLKLIKRIEKYFKDHDEKAGKAEAAYSRRTAEWCWNWLARQKPGENPKAVAVPHHLKRSRAVLSRSKRARRSGQSRLNQAFFALMRAHPETMVRNVARDLRDLVGRCAGETIYATSTDIFFHLNVDIPHTKRVIVLDATASPELLRPLFAPRTIHVVCNERVEPAGRVIQIMDFNGPRSHLNNVPRKMVKIIDAIGDLHPAGAIVLISHKSCVEKLKNASRHRDRIVTAHFGDIRGRNDLEPAPDRPIACHIVAGSPKTTEEDRRRLALAVHGKAILPFSDLKTVRKGVIGVVPHELTEVERQEAIWEVRLKGYEDPRMQAVYEHTVTAELTHAADRARVLIHEGAVVYLATNEPCPKLWFVEMCYAGDLLDFSATRRAHFEEAYKGYEAKARQLLNEGRLIGNADVCRALDRKPGWGKRYWHQFLRSHKDALEGERKVRWKEA